MAILVKTLSTKSYVMIPVPLKATIKLISLKAACNTW